MKVAIRVDASSQIGVGHLMRCLTLADALKERKAEVTFITRDLIESLETLVKNHGHRHVKLRNDRHSDNVVERDVMQLAHAHWLPVDWKYDAEQTVACLNRLGQFDWLVVDHYALDAQWENAVETVVQKILVIDDLADRAHSCNLLVDQNSYREYEYRYDNLVPSNCLKLLGASYALLRQEFKSARSSLRKRDGKISNILVFFGGGDATNETCKVLHSIKNIGIDQVAVSVVVGAANPHVTDIRKLSNQMQNVTVHVDIDYISQLMQDADLSIGAAGSATWERCALGLPSILIALAENQIEIAKSVERLGAGIYLGIFSEVTQESIEMAIRYSFEHPQKISEMSRIAAALVDAEGCQRVLKKMETNI